MTPHTPEPCEHTWRDGSQMRPNLGMIGSGAICFKCKVVIPWELVAAAPRLLAALEQTIGLIERMPNYSTIAQGGSGRRVLDEARSAIRQAKGGK